jgi:hypothetical protein
MANSTVGADGDATVAGMIGAVFLKSGLIR